MSSANPTIGRTYSILSDLSRKCLRSHGILVHFIFKQGNMNAAGLVEESVGIELRGKCFPNYVEEKVIWTGGCFIDRHEFCIEVHGLCRWLFSDTNRLSIDGIVMLGLICQDGQRLTYELYRDRIYSLIIVLFFICRHGFNNAYQYDYALWYVSRHYKYCFTNSSHLIHMRCTNYYIEN